MNVTCFYDQTPFTLSMEEKTAALRKMHAENLHHYDARCPRCGRANAISRERLEMFTPGWEEAIKAPAAAPMTPEKPAMPSMAAPTMAPMAPAASAARAAAPKKAAPTRKRHKPAAKKAAKKAARKPTKKAVKKVVKKKAKKTVRKPAKKTSKARKKR
jgi:hypothetical protein